MELTGIGESTAKKIIEYRKKNKFNSIEDIMNVNGIGESKFNSIKSSICVN
ncbi:ComE operon protein 1 [compost metagenome]